MRTNREALTTAIKGYTGPYNIAATVCPSCSAVFASHASVIGALPEQAGAVQVMERSVIAEFQAHWRTDHAVLVARCPLCGGEPQVLTIHFNTDHLASSPSRWGKTPA